MKRRVLIAYQILTGLSDTSTGLVLIAAPGLTLRLMRLHAASDTLPFLSYVGVFVLSVGLACLYGGWIALDRGPAEKLEVVWLLTAITRALVTVFVVANVALGSLEPGWTTVAFTDGVFTMIQIFGLAKGWLRSVRY